MLDLFKFTPTADPTYLDQAEFINNLNSITWVERYREPGEFSIEAQLSSGVMDILPLGTIISHVDTLEVMIVESHEIKEKTQEDPTIIITGRTFPSYLENRITATNLVRGGGLIDPYIIPSAKTWSQVVTIINDHIVTAEDVNDRLDDIVAVADSGLTGAPGETEERTIARGTVLQRVLELLEIDDLGMKTVRKNTFGVASDPPTYIVIYKGVDRSADVMFSWKEGDLNSVDYLFTQKKLKNSVMMVGQYVNNIVDLGPTGYDRRMAIMDGSDIDGHLGPDAALSDLIIIHGFLAIRGRQLLKKQKNVNISKADVSKTSKYDYRKDYNMGDLVSVDGNYGSIAVMRVVEYAEIVDENGASGHPTLALPEED